MTENREKLRQMMKEARKKMDQSSREPEQIVIPEDQFKIYHTNVAKERGKTALYCSLNNHKNEWDKEHPECPERYNRIRQRLDDLNIPKKCEVKFVEKMTLPLETLYLCHSEKHCCQLEKASNSSEVPHWKSYCEDFDSVFINTQTWKDACVAVQTVYDVAYDVCTGSVHNGFALVRPPGHHAMHDEHNGYCFFNNVAITASKLISDEKCKKILIVDIDVHHGQGIQQAFYDRNDILYFSIHRYEHGVFWPNLRESNAAHVGQGDGAGFNINIPLNETGCTDSDYLAIIMNSLLPVAYEFSPNLVIIAGGYDAAIGDPEGQMKVSPSFYGHLIHLLSGLAMGKTVVALEGGYNLDSLSEGVVCTMNALLGEAPGYMPPLEAIKPCVWDTINNSKFFLKSYWQCFNVLSENLDNVPIEQYLGEPDVKPFPCEGYYPKIDPTQNACVKQVLDETRADYSQRPENRTGITEAPDMLLHEPTCPGTSNMLEVPERYSCIYKELEKYDITKRMVMLERPPAGSLIVNDLYPCHAEEYLSKTLIDLDVAGKKDVYVKEEGSLKAVLACYKVIKQLIQAIKEKKILNGVAIVRPPGHHAHYADCGGFCLVNNVVLGAKYAIDVHKYKRVLIFDVDIHHGDGTQSMTYSRKDIMYISMHRYDFGAYYPGSSKAASNFTGEGLGEGYNVNIPFNKDKHGNSEYMLAFLNIVLPMAYAYGPDLVLVSAGYDAGPNDPLGKGYKVMPEMYGQMINLLKPLAKGNMLVCLEGGYNLTTLKYSMTMCCKALIGDPIPMPSLNFDVNHNCVDSIKSVIKEHKKFWPIFEGKKLTFSAEPC